MENGLPNDFLLVLITRNVVTVEESIMMAKEEEAIPQEEEALLTAEILFTLSLTFIRDRITVITIMQNKILP